MASPEQIGHVLPQLEISWQHQGVPIKAHLDFVLVWGAPVNAIRILEVKSTDKLPTSPHAERQDLPQQLGEIIAIELANNSAESAGDALTVAVEGTRHAHHLLNKSPNTNRDTCYPKQSQG